MNHSDIRKYLKQGEQAVDVLKSLGYVYVANGKEHPHWVAPVKPIDGLREQIEALIDKEVQERSEKVREGISKGPNWENVAHLQGKKFSVMTGSIPKTSKLREYHPSHFSHKQFICLEVRYYRSPEYTGYAVLFDFAVRPHSTEVVWLPLSACAFSK